MLVWSSRSANRLYALVQEVLGSPKLARMCPSGASADDIQALAYWTEVSFTNERSALIGHGSTIRQLDDTYRVTLSVIVALHDSTDLGHRANADDPLERNVGQIGSCIPVVIERCSCRLNVS